MRTRIATPEVCGQECLKRARLVDVLRSDPDGATVGSSATITAQGFAATSALTVKVGGTTATITAGATTSAAGSSTITFTIPNVPNGAQTVAVTDFSLPTR